MAQNTKKRASVKKKKASAKKKKKSTKATARRKRSDKKTKIKRKYIILFAVAAVLIAALVITAIAVNSRKPKNHSLAQFNNKKVWGIDVSSHNGEIDWKQVSSEAEFAFIRVGYRGYTEGEINYDKKANYNLKQANRNNLPVGVYFYSQAINAQEAEDEADAALKVIKKYDISLPVVIDFEYASKGNALTGRLYEAGLSKNQNTVIINAFCDKVREAGYVPGIYASSFIYRSHLNVKNIPKDVFIWVADYNKTVTYFGYYDIWQYSDKGSCKGVSSQYVDTNYYYTKKRS